MTTTPTVPDASEVDIPPCPERPPSLDRASAVRFAARLERARVVRTVLRDHPRVVSIDVDVRTAGAGATGTRDGWVVHLPVTGPAYRYRPDPGSPKTAHVDPPACVASYLVAE